MSKKSENRPKVAIIGSGGAGLCAAWLLRHSYDITIFEADSQLGGHAHTLYMTGDDGFANCPVDTGFRLFHHEKNPTLGKYFNLLGVPTRVNRLSLNVKTYNTIKGEEKVVEEVFAPPLHSFKFFLKNLRSPWVNRGALIYFKGLKEHKRRIKNGLTKQPGITLQDTIEKYKGSYKPLYRMIYPITMGAFVGSTYDDIPRYDFDNFIDFLHESKAVDPFKIEYSTVIGGIANYVAMVENILTADKRVRILKNTPISKVTKNRTQNKVVSRQAEFSESFDHVVMAVPPDVVLSIFPGVNKQVKKVMAMVELVSTRTIIHKDKRYAFPDDMYLTCHTFEDKRTNFVVGHPLLTQGRKDFILTTTAKEDQINPDDFQNVHQVYDRYGYALTPTTIHARNLLPEIQGIDNTWYCGAWGAGHYSHEGCISTAVAVAEGLGIKNHPLK